MNLIQRLADGVSRRLERTNLSFSLREAVVVSLAGIAIASAVAYHFAG